jgi:hypothetical protein
MSGVQTGLLGLRQTYAAFGRFLEGIDKRATELRTVPDCKRWRYNV